MEYIWYILALNDKLFATEEKEEKTLLMQELEDMELSLLTGGIFISTPGCTMEISKRINQNLMIGGTYNE